MAKMTDKEIIKMRIKRIEKEIRDTPYHKATEHHIGRLRAKLSNLKSRAEEQESKRAGSGGGSYAVKKQGDATVVIVGPPSVGKSTLINKLTNAKSKIAPYAFTTVSVIPGMMDYHDAKIQILDVPGLIEGGDLGKGRGREVLSVVRGADLLLIMCDVENKEAIGEIKDLLEESNIRINKTPPNVTVKKKLKGGLQIISNIKQDLPKEVINEVAKEIGIKNAEITVKENLTIDSLIDSLSKNRVYIPAIFVINKVDLQSTHIRTRELVHGYNKVINISAEKGININKLVEEIWNNLKLIRIYLVRRNEKPSNYNPLIVKDSSTLEDIAKKIGNEFVEDKKRAKIWGSGSKFPGQEVSLNTKVTEGIRVRFS